MLECIFLVLYLLVPDHRKVPLDVRLRLVGVGEHFEVGAAELSGQYVCLCLHQGILLSEELLANDVGTESGLDHQSSRLFDKTLLSLIV